jgi:alkylation response protein AidB-like acyl-CoA dehydrogenase
MDALDESPDIYGLSGRGGRYYQNTQIYEGTNQVQRIVVAKHLLK